jgi:hypothetical protein
MVIGLDSGAAKAIIINFSGNDYEVTTFVASFDDPAFSAKFATPANGGTMPWWGDQQTAIQWSNAVGTALGTPNTVLGFAAGPRFAWEIFEPSAGSEAIRFASFLPISNGTVSSVTDGPAVRTYAEILPSLPPRSRPRPPADLRRFYRIRHESSSAPTHPPGLRICMPPMISIDWRLLKREHDSDCEGQPAGCLKASGPASLLGWRSRSPWVLCC